DQHAVVLAPVGDAGDPLGGRGGVGEGDLGFLADGSADDREAAVVLLLGPHQGGGLPVLGNDPAPGRPQHQGAQRHRKGHSRTSTHVVTTSRVWPGSPTHYRRGKNAVSE